jgi:hypothetical protein
MKELGLNDWIKRQNGAPQSSFDSVQSTENEFRHNGAGTRTCFRTIMA